MLNDDLESPFVEDAPGEQPSLLPARAPEPRALRAWKIAIVDDEQEVHDVTTLALRSVSFSERTLSFLSARSAAEARLLLAEHTDLALVLLDVVMETDDAGLDLVRYIRESLGNHKVRVVLRTGQPGQAPESTVIRNFDISDYRTKTELTSTRLFTTVISALRTYQQLEAVTAQREELSQLYAEQKLAFEKIAELKAELERERDYLREEVKGAGGGTMLGGSPAFVKMLSQLDAVAKTDASVLVLGDSGVGKELVVREIHARSRRAAGPLVKVNCAGVPRELFESEFFGHVKGAFTGAHRDREGRFQLAHGGTLFLDEVGEIPLDLQSKLLRALQEREIERVGDTQARTVDVRVIAATNRDLKAAVDAGTFRADLFYRLQVFPLKVPALRERREDILVLFEHFLARASHKLGRPILTLDACAAHAVESYAWPGNVRELEHAAERAAILSHDGVLRLDAILPDLAVEDVSPNVLSMAVDPARRALETPARGYFTADELRQLERQNLIQVLDQAGGRVSGEGGAAELLGVKSTTLAYQLKSFGITRKG